MIRNRISHILFALMAIGVLSACDRTALVRGTVLDVSGHGLPGVAVTLPGFEYQAVTNVLGRYSLRCAPGALELHFIKTGYTSGRLTVEAKGPGSVDVTTVYLWPLPEGKGVYFFENYRYSSTTRCEPKRYAVKGAGTVYGTRIEPDLIWYLPNDENGDARERPLIIAHKLPSYDIALTRLEEVDGMPVDDLTADAITEAAAAKFTEKIWIPAENCSIIVAPVDEPERILLDVHPIDPLAPGVYAVHWGALDGFASTEPRAFLFQIAPPLEIPEPEGAIEDNEDDTTEDDT